MAYSKHSECPNPTKRERESKGKKIENATQKGGNERNMRQRREITTRCKVTNSKVPWTPTFSCIPRKNSETERRERGENGGREGEKEGKRRDEEVERRKEG